MPLYILEEVQLQQVIKDLFTNFMIFYHILVVLCKLHLQLLEFYVNLNYYFFFENY